MPRGKTTPQGLKYKNIFPMAIRSQFNGGINKIIKIVTPINN